MKTCSLLTLTITMLLFSACTDQLAGPALDTQPETSSTGAIAASKGASGDLADLALRISTDKAKLFPMDTLRLTVELHNEGPDVATGVQVAIQLNEDGQAAGGGGGDDGFTLWDIIHEGVVEGDTAAEEDDGFILWDIIHEGIAPGETQRLTIVALANGTGMFTHVAEVAASDMQDPDSVPGDGGPDQDDFSSVTVVVGSGPSQ